MAIRVGELNRRPHAPDPPDRPAAPAPQEARAQPESRTEGAARPDDTRRTESGARPEGSGRSVSPEQREALDRLTGVASRRDRPTAPEAGPLSAPATAKSEIAELKARRDVDKAEFAGQKAPDRTPALDAAHARIAELEKQVSTLESDKTEAKSRLDAANTKLADQEKRLEEQGAKLDAAEHKIADQQKRLDEHGTALSDLQESVKHLQDRRPADSREASALNRVDERTSAQEMRDDRLSQPKRLRGELRASAVETAIAGGGLAGTALSIGAEMPSYVTSVAAAAAGAAWATTRLVRKWREGRNDDRPGG